MQRKYGVPPANVNKHFFLAGMKEQDFLSIFRQCCDETAVN